MSERYSPLWELTMARVREVIREPKHPYTQGLIACAPGHRSDDIDEPLAEQPRHRY